VAVSSTRGVIHPTPMSLPAATVMAAALALIGVATTGCGGNADRPPAAPSQPVPQTAAESTATSAADCSPAGLIVFDGDSLTEGYFLPESQSYPTQAMRQLPAWLEWTNVAVSGQTWPDLLGDATAEVDALHDPARQLNLVVVWAGANDLASGRSARQAFHNARRYCEARVHAGFTVVTLTMYPLEPAAIDPGYDVQRREYNRLLRTHWREFAHGLVDVAADERLGDASPAGRSTYFLDAVHLNAAGYGVIADAVATALRSIVADASRSAP